MFLGYAGSKVDSGLEFLKPKGLAAGGFVLVIIPFCPPAGVVFRHLKVKVGNIRMHLTAKAAGLELQRAPDGKDLTPKCPMGFYPQETLTKHDETRNVQNCVGIQIMELNPVCE
jgi:hypothetical protein